MNCTLTNQSRSSSPTSRARGLDELGPVDGLEVHGEAGAHAPRASWRGRARAGRRGRCRRPCAPGRSRAPSRAAAGSPSSPIASSASSTDSGSGPGRASSSAPAAVDVRREDAEAARALGRGRLHADVALGVAELRRRRRGTRRALRTRRVARRLARPRARRQRPSSRTCRGRRAIASGEATSSGIGEELAAGGQRARTSADDCGNTTSTPSRCAPASATAGANSGRRPRGTTWNASHRKRPPRARLHVGADHHELALAVLAQGADEPRPRPARPVAVSERRRQRALSRAQHDPAHDLEALGVGPADLDAVRAGEVADVLLVRVVAVLLRAVAVERRAPSPPGGAPRASRTPACGSGTGSTGSRSRAPSCA